MKRPLLLALLLGGPPVTTLLGFAIGSAWLLPLLGAAPAAVVFVDRIRSRRSRSALGWMLVWALVQSLAMGIAVTAFPERAEQVVLTGRPYADEMLHWVRTGEGPEGSPRLFLPIHARHYLGFCAVTVLSTGVAGLALGTWLLNYMNFYVAELARASVHGNLAAGIGWPPWAVIRVVGFIATAVALAPLGLSLLARLRGRSERWPVPRGILLLGVALVVVDALLKALLAPTWQRLVLGALTGER